MKIFRLIGLFLVGSSTLFSCSNNEDELLPKEQEQSNQETYTISFDLGGEFISTSDTPLSRNAVTPKKKIYGINVYYTKDGEQKYQNYAYGLFDNIEDMTISLIGGYKYKFECSMVKNDCDTLYYDNHTYYAPFYYYYNSNNGNYSGIELSNEFKISTTSPTYIKGLKSGATSISGRGNSSKTNYPRTDRFYGELEDYVPSKDGIANIDLKRTAFGLKFIVTPPADGTLSVSSIAPNIKISSIDSTIETFSIYTFYDVYECWRVDKYVQDFTIRLTWVRANGATQTFEKIVTAKRNVMTTINVNVNGSSTDSSLGVKEEDTPMGSENVDMNFDGGDLDDNEVNPSK